MPSSQSSQTLEEHKVDSTANLARRYRHLFRLPPSNLTVAFSSVLLVTLSLVSRGILGTPIIYNVALAAASEIIFLVAISLDLIVLKRRHKVATYRRLASIAIISNLLWLLLCVAALVVFSLTGSPGRSLALIIVGAFFAVAFRALIIGTLFYSRPIAGLPLSALQPALLYFPVAFDPGILSIHSLAAISAIVAGLIGIASIEVYMLMINRTSIAKEYKPLELLQAFLNAWAAEDATALERFFEIVSREREVRSNILKLVSNSKSAMVIVPGVHPGPFYPIGSSNLPGEIYSRLHDESTLPLTSHSISDHDLNLSSKRQVEKFVSTLKQPDKIEAGERMTLPVVKTKGKVTATGIAFGKTLLIALTMTPHGMEDFPTEVRDSILSFSKEAGFKNTLVIDTHNSEGEKPDESDCINATDAASLVVSELKDMPQSRFRLGFAHSSELGLANVERDVGPAGVGLLLFQPEKGGEFSLVIVDANNALIGFRENVFSSFESATGSKVLELCTSDTHVTAAKTRDAKGYLALGDLISSEKFSSMLVSLHERAKSSLGEASFESSEAKSHVKTIGSEVLGEFSGLLDSASSVAKNGAQILAIIAIVLTVVVALL